MKGNVRVRHRARLWWVGVFIAALVGAGAAVTLQYRSAIDTSKQLLEQQTETVTALLVTEVTNVAQYGPYRQERLTQMFDNLVQTGAVSHLRLEDSEGDVRVEAGTAWGAQAPGSGVEITRHLEIRESFAASHGVSHGTLTVGGPGSNPSGLLSGEVTLILQFSHARIDDVRRDTRIHLLVSLVLVILLGGSALLWLRATRRSLTAERQLRRVEEKSEHLEAINLMASGLAHEIRNPIGAVHGFAQLLAERFPEDSSEGRYAQVMLESLDEVSERVTRLLSFARPKKPECKPEDLDSLVRNVVRLITPDIEQKEVSLSPSYESGDHRAMVDASKIKEVVLNLTLNALDAIQPGGQLRVETRYDVVACAHILRVQDDGEGISAEDLKRVFTPYVTTKSKGSGLGLAICKRIVEDHGGSIELESERGVGTTVTVTIPAPSEP